MLFGFNASKISNSAMALTNVELSRNNFKVIGNAEGTATNWYLFFIGGLALQNLFGSAYQEMLKNAKLKDKSRAVINVTYDWHIRFIFFIYADITITVYGTVIEFTDCVERLEKNSGVTVCPACAEEINVCPACKEPLA